MRKYPEQVRRRFSPDPVVRAEWRLESLKRTEQMYRQGFHYAPVPYRAGSGADCPLINIVAVRREIAELEAQLRPTFTLEEILAEL